MKDLINQITENQRKEGWAGFNKIKDQMLQEDTRELIINLMKVDNVMFQNIGALFIVIPELWKDYDLEDWLYIIRNAERPKNYRVLIDDGTYFEDIRFLYNWIGIDSVDLYKNDSQISKANKDALDNVFPDFLSDTMRNGDSYKEDFKDGTFGNIEYFREMNQRLINQGAKENLIGSL